MDILNVERAYQHKTLTELKQQRFLLRVVFNGVVIFISRPLIKLALWLHIPITWAVKPTVYKFFCGGEKLDEALDLSRFLMQYNVKTVLDFAAEETHSQKQSQETFSMVMKIIQLAKENPQIAFAVFKPSALCKVRILEKISNEEHLTNKEEEEFYNFKTMVDRLCAEAYNRQVPLLIDAEYCSMQKAIDDILLEMMRKYNKERAIVYNTLQMYRKDRLNYLRQLYEIAQQENFYIGIKFVRGAYLEYERKLAKQKGIASPVHETKAATDKDFNDALRFCMQHIERFSIFNATHNEESSLLLVSLMKDKQLPTK